MVDEKDHWISEGMSMDEDKKTPDFFAAAKAKQAYNELEAAYFEMFDEGLAAGQPGGMTKARLKDHFIQQREMGDEEAKSITNQIDYMFLRWQIIRGYA